MHKIILFSFILSSCLQKHSKEASTKTLDQVIAPSNTELDKSSLVTDVKKSCEDYLKESANTKATSELEKNFQDLARTCAEQPAEELQQIVSDPSFSTNLLELSKSPDVAQTPESVDNTTSASPTEPAPSASAPSPSAPASQDPQSHKSTEIALFASGAVFAITAFYFGAKTYVDWNRLNKLSIFQDKTRVESQLSELKTNLDKKTKTMNEFANRFNKKTKIFGFILSYSDIAYLDFILSTEDLSEEKRVRISETCRSIENKELNTFLVDILDADASHSIESKITTIRKLLTQKYPHWKTQYENAIHTAKEMEKENIALANEILELRSKETELNKKKFRIENTIPGHNIKVSRPFAAGSLLSSIASIAVFSTAGALSLAQDPLSPALKKFLTILGQLSNNHFKR